MQFAEGDVSSDTRQISGQRGDVSGSKEFFSYLSGRRLDDSTFAFPLCVQIHSGTILVFLIFRVNVEQLNNKSSHV